MKCGNTMSDCSKTSYYIVVSDDAGAVLYQKGGGFGTVEEAIADLYDTYKEVSYGLGSTTLFIDDKRSITLDEKGKISWLWLDKTTAWLEQYKHGTSNHQDQIQAKLGMA